MIVRAAFLLSILATVPAAACDTVARPDLLCTAPAAPRQAARVARRGRDGHARPPLARSGVGSVRASSGASASVSPAAAGAFQCLIDRLEAQGYRVHFMGGYRARGSVRGSLHPAGMALDINQYARGVTRPRMPGNEIALANSCGLISGAQWAHNDSGHFQLGGYDGSASRRSARRGHHRHHRPR